MKLFYCLLLLVCACLCRAEKIHPLHVKDRLPEALLTGVQNYKAVTILLSSFKGKVFIIDFWATWCSSCVEQLPLEDSLQKALGSKVQFLLAGSASVNDTRQKVQSFLNRRMPHVSLPYITGDTLLTALFPHQLLPHYVWIAPDGTVAAITGAEGVTAGNILACFNNGTIQLPLKQDVTDYDPLKPLLYTSNGGPSSALIFSSTLTRYLPGLGSGARNTSDSIITKVTYLNMQILALYQAAAGFDGNRVMVFTKDSARFFRMQRTEDAFTAALYCYEYTCPAAMPKSAVAAALLHDLDQRLGLTSSKATKEVPCYIVTRITGSIKEVKAHKSSPAREPYITLNGEPCAELVKQLNTQLPEAAPKPIFIDSTNCAGAISLTLYSDIQNIAALAAELRSYGFTLMPSIKKLPVFIIKDPAGY